MASGWWRFIGAILPAILLFHGFCYSDTAPNYTFVQEATTAPPTLYYDYIIIGGGTSGCPLGATLSQNASVLVLERGGSPYGNPNITNIGSFAASLSDNSPTSPSQLFISEDGVFNTRARVLGGGSALNAGFYTRASRDYVRELGWEESLVNQSYEWVEKKVVFQPPMLQFQSAVRDGLLEVGVHPFNGFTYDHIYGTKVGGTIFDRDGHRHTAADLLEYADPKRITVLLHARVQKILFRVQGESRPRAYGVIYKDALGYNHRAYLSRDSMNEIILSAGAIGSPQVLMLSGVGPANHLRTHNITVLVDQPLIGRGLTDNPMNAIFIPSPQPVEVSLIQVVGITRFDSYIEAASGSMFGYTSAVQRSNGSIELLSDQNNGQHSPDATATAAAVNNTLTNSSIKAGVILEKIMGPLSAGYLELRNTNPDDNPSITFNYFKEPEDLQRCVEGIRTITQIINSKAFSNYRYQNVPVQALIQTMLNMPLNLRPRHVNASFSLEQFCIDTVMTIWHYHGGCQVGRVVDRDYKVLGVDALRVIDGSTFNFSPGTNPQATVMMLGRYMGERILQERLEMGGSS